MHVHVDDRLRALSLTADEQQCAGCGEPDARDGTSGPAATTGSTELTANSTTGTTGGGVMGCLSAMADDGSLNLSVDPANNYAFDSTVTFNVQRMAPNTPFTFDWSELTVDLMKQPINPAAGEVVAVLMSLIFTFAWSQEPNPIGQFIAHIGEGRTIGYKDHGAAGMLTLFVRAMLCNWMVSTGVVGAMISTHVSGKVLAMWMPIMVFFYMTFEHSVVNMFLFPSGLIMGAAFSLGDYFLWNEIPTILGNLVGGLMFTGATLYSTHARTAPSRMALRGSPSAVTAARRIASLASSGRYRSKASAAARSDGTPPIVRLSSASVRDSRTASMTSSATSPRISRAERSNEAATAAASSGPRIAPSAGPVCAVTSRSMADKPVASIALSEAKSREGSRLVSA